MPIATDHDGPRHHRGTDHHVDVDLHHDVVDHHLDHVAPGAELVLRANGLGDAVFGADPDGVIAYVTSIIGPSTVDTGWVDPLSVGACPGTEFRRCPGAI